MSEYVGNSSATMVEQGLEGLFSMFLQDQAEERQHQRTMEELKVQRDIQNTAAAVNNQQGGLSNIDPKKLALMGVGIFVLWRVFKT